VTALLHRIGLRLARLSPRALLGIGWLGLMLYAYPGFLSADSVVQLGEARSGVYGGGHPPMMSALWALTDAVIGGPFGMLAIQTTCFLIGGYLLLRRAMSDRAAAICTALLLWAPPVSAVMAVIWKDAQMAGFLLLGAGLLLSPRRGWKLAGLGLLCAATGMRYNALAITLPLVVLLFVWSAAHRWWLRYPIAVVAWLCITLGASFVNDRLTAEPGRTYVWHESLALLDLVGTLREAPDLPDDELRPELAGTPLIVTTDIQRAARGSFRAEDIPEPKRMTFGGGDYLPALWVTTFHVFAVPTTADQRAAIARAWKQIVLGHPRAYLAYRWRVFRELVHLGDREIPSGAYVWFTDVLDISGSAQKLGHNASPSKLQVQLRDAMLWLGDSWMFRPSLYLLLSLVLLPLCLRHREILTLALSGLANEAALFVLAPTLDYRYSFWLVIATGLVVMMLIARRARSRAGFEVIDDPRDVGDVELAA
jgi:hypothetical protein